MEIHEDGLRKTFTLERQIECFSKAVARRELSYKELRHFLEEHVPEIYDGEDTSLTQTGDAAFGILFEADYHGHEETIIREFCRLTNVPYHLSATSASTVYVEMTSFAG